MKNKFFIILIAGIFFLASCNTLNDLGISGGGAEEGLELQEIQPEPTEAVVPEGAFFREEFEKDIIQNWGLRVVSGLEKQMIWDQNNDRLRLQTLGPNDVNIIFLNKKNTYEDVIVQANVENRGPLNNAYSLICRANENGWYEFRISSNGYYELLRFDQYKQDEGDNAYTNLLKKRVGSTKIKSGLDTNTFSLSCVGNVISAFVNGEQLYWEKRPLGIEDETFREGAVGFGLLGYGDELDMVYNWVEAVRP